MIRLINLNENEFKFNTESFSWESASSSFWSIRLRGNFRGITGVFKASLVNVMDVSLVQWSSHLNLYFLRALTVNIFSSKWSMHITECFVGFQSLLTIHKIYPFLYKFFIIGKKIWRFRTPGWIPRGTILKQRIY